MPLEKWISPSPVITKLVPGHDRRLLTEQSNITVPLEIHFSDIMACESVLSAVAVKSVTGGGSHASIDRKSVACRNIAVADSDVSALTGKPTGEIPCAFIFTANLIGVSHGLHQITVANVSTREGNAATNVSQYSPFQGSVTQLNTFRPSILSGFVSEALIIPSSSQGRQTIRLRFYTEVQTAVSTSTTRLRALTSSAIRSIGRQAGAIGFPTAEETIHWNISHGLAPEHRTGPVSM